MEFDYRLKVFYVAANTLNFTKAATELFISQPAVSKNIQEIENTVGTPLFERLGNRLILTKAGSILYHHTQLIFEQYNQASYEINKIIGKGNGSLFIGISTTISQYVIPKILAQFVASCPQNDIKVYEYNSKRVEELLLRKEIHIGITEGLTDNRSLKFTPFLKDEIVLVTNTQNPLFNKEEFSLKDLYYIPLVIRETGSGTRDIIEERLRQKGIATHKLRIEITLSSTESIKEYLKYSKAAAFVSIHAISNELNTNQLRIIELTDLNIERNFYITHLHGGLTGLPETFLKYIQKHKNHIYS
ncbi:LysR substrate-binding domain-containing protein [Sphingobacterium spiritivorum]